MRRWVRTAKDRRGAAAVEFALVTPVLVVVAMSLTDVSNAVITWWRLSAAAGAIARMATTFAATTTNTNVLTLQQAATASTAVYALVPTLATAPASSYGVVISSVVMTPKVPGCVANCTYVANTAWSAALQGVATTRPCGQLSAVPDGQPSTLTTLPTDAFTSAPVVVVDITYDFLPLFNNLFGGGLQFTETAYMPPRTGDDSEWTRLTGPNAASAQCPGYTE